MVGGKEKVDEWGDGWMSGLMGGGWMVGGWVDGHM